MKECKMTFETNNSTSILHTLVASEPMEIQSNSPKRKKVMCSFSRTKSLDLKPVALYFISSSSNP
jgi:hypothetical protein